MGQAFIQKLDRTKVLSAIARAETDTSGEIRVHIEPKLKGDVLDRAVFIFQKLEMHRTQLRNGVLFYLAWEDRKFAILGDAGINAVVPPGFWDQIQESMGKHFREGQFTEGLETGILMAGSALRTYFPHLSDDKNELTDEISFGQL